MRLGQRLVSVELNQTSMGSPSYYSIEQAMNDFDILLSAKTSLESHGALESKQLTLISNIVGTVYGRNNIVMASVESHGALEASLEGALDEIWRKVKNGVIDGVIGIGNFFEWLGAKLDTVVSKVFTGLLVGLTDVLYLGSASSWIRLIGTNEFFKQYKWNESITANINHDKVITAAIEQINNASEFFKNYEEYVKTFHDGVSKVLAALEKGTKDIEKLVKDYNADTNVKLVRILDKLFPSKQWNQFQSSKILLGGKVIGMADARFHKLRVLDEEVMITEMKGNRHNLDQAPDNIRIPTDKFKKMIEEAKKSCKVAKETATKVKGFSVDVEKLFDKLDKSTYEQYLSDTAVTSVRNFVRDVGLMIDTLNTGAVTKYYEIFAEKMEAAETLVTKK